jgi:uncharacterized protein (DUF1697 family)
MGVHIALLRGINVGGRHRLPMKELIELFEAAGCGAVTTHIQSGNVMFEGSAACARAASSRVAKGIEAAFGFSSPVIVRSLPAFRKAVGAHPFDGPGVEPSKLMVGFLDRRPDPGSARGLEPERFLPDRVELRGSEVYLHYPNGAARSKLTNAWLDRTLGVVSTVRNWNTVTKLVELCGARPKGA